MANPSSKGLKVGGNSNEYQTQRIANGIILPRGSVLNLLSNMRKRYARLGMNRHTDENESKSPECKIKNLQLITTEKYDLPSYS